MKTSVIESPKHIRIIEAELPEIGAEEVLVKLEGTGLCVSHVPMWEGREWFSYPFEPGSPGHEGYGMIERVGDKVQGLTKGDKVALISYHAYAEYDKTHMSNVVRISGMPSFPGEPMACAVNVFNRSDIDASQTVTVIGTDYLGCLLIQLIKSTGAHVIGVSHRKSSLEFAGRSGADDLVHFTDVWETIQNIRRITPKGNHRIIEVTGTQESIDVATDIISERGRMIIAGHHQDGLRKINMQLWNWKGLDVINAHERIQAVYAEGLRQAVEYVHNGTLRPQELITHQFDFNEINRGFQMMQNQPEGFLKAVIRYS